MARFYPLVVGQGNGTEPGETRGAKLLGLAQYMHIEGLTLEDMLEELEKLHVKGTVQQLSKARRGLLTLTMPGEIRLLDVMGEDDIRALLTPAYDPEMEERVKAHRERVKAAG